MKYPHGFLLGLLLTILPFSILRSAPPAWSATGDSFAANIVFPTLENQIKKMPVQDGKVVGASLRRKADNTISGEILIEMTKEQFQGVVCRLTTDLVIVSMDASKADIKMQNTDVESCRTDRGPVFDSMAVMAAKVGIQMVIDRVQTDVNSSVNRTIYSTVDILKKETGEGVKLDYRVYTEGLSLFIYTGDKSEPTRFRRVPYEAIQDPSCSEVLLAKLYHSYDTASPYRGNVTLTVRNLTGKSKADWLQVKMKGGGLSDDEVGSGYILPGNDFTWTGPLAARAGKELTVEFYSGSTLFKAFNSKCGDYRFVVPGDGDLEIVIER